MQLIDWYQYIAEYKYNNKGIQYFKEKKHTGQLEACLNNSIDEQEKYEPLIKRKQSICLNNLIVQTIGKEQVNLFDFKTTVQS